MLYNFHFLLFPHQLEKSSQEDLLVRLNVNISTHIADNPLLLLLWKGMCYKINVSEDSSIL